MSVTTLKQAQSWVGVLRHSYVCPAVCCVCRYGYVSFFSKEAADLAISTFDDQLQLQVRTVTSNPYQLHEESGRSLAWQLSGYKSLLHAQPT